MNLEELCEVIEKKHARATSPGERIIVKWLGWLTFFLLMNKEGRVRFVEDESTVDATIKVLTKDLNELRTRSITINDRGIKSNRKSSK